MKREPKAGGGAASGRDSEPGGDVYRKLSDYHDGRYAPGSREAAEVEGLLAENPRYAEVLADYRLISEAAKCLRAGDGAPRRGVDEFAALVRGAIASSRRRRVALWTGWGVAAAAAAAIVVAFVLAPEVEPPPGAGLAEAPEAPETLGADEAHGDVKTAVLGPEAAREPPQKTPEAVPAAADPDAVRRQIEEAESRGGRMPGVIPVDEGGVPSAEAKPGPGRGFLGVLVRDPTPTEPAEGAVVTGVVAGSPAALRGVESGDVILRVAGRVIGVGGARLLKEIVGRAGPGAAIGVVYRRGREVREVEIVLADGRQSPRGLPDVPAGRELNR